MMLSKPGNDPTFKLLRNIFNDELKRHPTVSSILKNAPPVHFQPRCVFLAPLEVIDRLLHM